MAVLSKRNIIITCFNVLSAGFLICFWALLAYLSKDLPQTFVQMMTEPNVLIPSATLIFAVLAVFFIRKFFLQTTRAEIFFFLIFILTINFDGIRPVVYILEQLEKPEEYILLLTRMAYFGKILGVFSLLCFALMTTETDYKPFSTVLNISIVVAMFIAAMMPFSQSKGANALFIPGIGMFFNSIVALKILAVLTLAFNAIQNKNWEYLNLAVSLVFILAGSHILFYTASFAIATAGMLLTIVGTVFISYRIHRLYLWS